jgi:large subunit ribosomal protein L9
MFILLVFLLLSANIAICYKVLPIPRLHSYSCLYAKDVKKVNKDQTRVRLLSDIKDIGKKGQIVLVSNGMYMNSLGPKKQAEKVSDEEMNKIEETESIKNKNELDNALSIQTNIKAMNRLLLTRKKGKDGQLFGAVTTKMVIEELRTKFGSDNTLSNNNKNLIVVSMMPQKSEDGSLLGGELVNNEIRKVGVYVVELKLHPKVSISFELVVNSD